MILDRQAAQTYADFSMPAFSKAPQPSNTFIKHGNHQAMNENRSTQVSQAFSYLFLLYSVFMLLWGVLGFAEYFVGSPMIVPLQNPNFPAGTQLLHWLLISACGLSYVIGYSLRWRYTPFAMAIIFAMLASMCFIQTFDFMTRPDRYIAFAIECFMYIALSRYLFRSKLMRQRFGLDSPSQHSPSQR